MNLVNSTKESLQNLRNDETYKNIYEQSKQIALQNKVRVEEYEERNNRLKRNISFNKNFKDYFVTSTLGKSNSKGMRAVPTLKAEVLYSIIDRFVQQLETRFSEKNQELFKIFQIFDYTSLYYFNPKCPSLEFFIDHYKYFEINKIKVKSEFSSAKALNFKTLPISTASNERFFSSMKNVKSYIRTSMGDERLSDLMIISVEKDEANKIDLNKAVDDFGKMKNRRYPLF
ncbi:unnamed protein product [Macrosiphum euphorbiae]|uniref:HAT C-terminal dimerisation domain-containing protein n=1 Tax=Macrosiphum euphorbiae TaxID=13131 RepID=A0AAV0YCF4_9HEMI|nr:unnamed protein product [Macrosiphum euphorbiae]